MQGILTFKTIAQAQAQGFVVISDPKALHVFVRRSIQQRDGILRFELALVVQG